MASSPFDDIEEEDSFRFDRPNHSGDRVASGDRLSFEQTPQLRQIQKFNTPQKEESVSDETIQDDTLNRKQTIMKRTRLGTRRHPKGNPLGRNKTFKWKRQHSKRPEQSDEETEEESSKRHEHRKVFWNMDLPSDMKDEKDSPIMEYPRNKIRTTKYTPLSFVPKNIMYQFYNVANIYFLTMIILGAFQIFGVPNPALSAVPLIVIVIITAIKDAIEDSRRTALDMEVNNQRTQTLSGIDNPNQLQDNVSLWRKFKKANSRGLFAFIEMCQRGFSKSNAGPNFRASLETYRSSMGSRDSMDSIGSVLSTNERPFLDRSEPPASVKFHNDYWKNVKVGDMVRVVNNQEVPADLLILATSDEDAACYVETKNLDGETNLKVKQAMKCSSVVKRARHLSQCKFYIESEGPHPNLYSYQGAMKWNHGEEVEPATINNMLLRGCFLRNTKWVIGIAMFTGVETKIMLNAGITPTKKSKISRDLNWAVIANFGLLFAMCLISGIVNGVYYRTEPSSRDYFEYGTIAGSPAVNGLVSFWVAMILYSSLVPISLYISIEIIKTAQAYFIYSDVKMYHPKLDYPCTPKSWNISDDLGQIEYVFSDKTGTLTQNVMEMKKSTIAGVSYGRAYTEAYAGMRKRLGVDVETESKRELAEIRVESEQMAARFNRIDPSSFVSMDLTADLLDARSGQPQQQAVHEFMLSLALCHSVITDEDPKTGKLLLKAQSPDEEALVSTARDCGFAFTDRTKKGVVLDVQGQRNEFQVLNVIEFNSTRKRMSIILKFHDKALLICKGADSIIYERLGTQNDPKVLETTTRHLQEYASEGLRTLCIAQKEIPWDEYQEWNLEHEKASSAIKDRDELVEKCADAIERGLTLLGGTAIEDRLQDGVPDSIQLLSQAGIKLWVLTGDKVETAINIGFSCNLLSNEMNLAILKTPETASAELSKYLSSFFDMDGSEELGMEKASLPSANHGVVIDGSSLEAILRNAEATRKFLLLCTKCSAVLCCRVSPAQKAAVVRLVKERLGVITLAIGDGSNDVAMIQQAHVGVGIAGEEGRQAVMSSDYAIGQFRFLTRLILVHGRWSYKRLAEMIPSFFYKNVIFTLALFWYGCFDDFDGTYLFEFTYLMFYNLAFTSLPVIFLGIFDQDVNDVVSLLVPQLYRTGILGTEWTNSKFWWYMIDGGYQSVICFFYPYLVYYKNGFITSSALPMDHRYLIGTLVTSIATLSCNLYILAHQYRWDWFCVLFIALSILIVFAWTGIWTASMFSGEFFKAAPKVYGSLAWWCCLFVGILACLLPRLVYDFLQKLYFPKDVDVIRECVLRGDFAQYPQDYDPTDPNRSKISDYSREHTSAEIQPVQQFFPSTNSLATEEIEMEFTHRKPVEVASPDLLRNSINMQRQSLEKNELALRRGIRQAEEPRTEL